VAITSNFAVWPSTTLWLAGCVVIDGPAAVDVPLRESVRDGSEASLATMRLPVEFPVDFGANSTCTAWVIPGAREIVVITPVRRKPDPETVAWEMVTAVVPEFVRVNVCKLFAPIDTFPKSRVVVLGARVPKAALLEPGFDGVPALVNPTQPEIDKIEIKSVAIVANVASELCCVRSRVAACFWGAGCTCWSVFVCDFMSHTV